MAKILLKLLYVLWYNEGEERANFVDIDFMKKELDRIMGLNAPTFYSMSDEDIRRLYDEKVVLVDKPKLSDNVDYVVIPRAADVVIPRNKLIYSLETDVNKKRLWRALLDFGIDDIDIVEQYIREGVITHKSMLRHIDEYGNHFYVVMLMVSHAGTLHRVLTSWIDDVKAKKTRLTTVYPLTYDDKREVVKS